MTEGRHWQRYVVGCDDPVTTAPTAIGLIEPGASAVVDFGRNLGGRLVIEFGEASAGPVLVATAEMRRYLEPRGDYLGDGGPHRFEARPGTWRADRVNGAFRHLLVTNEGSGPIDVTRVAVERVTAPDGPAGFRGRFLCDDDLVNRAWYASVYTVQLNTTVPADGSPGFVFDGPKRDRLYWTGDLLIEAPTAWVSFDADGAIRNSLAQAARDQSDDGSVQVMGPGDRRPLRWLSYVAAWASVLWGDVLHSGDEGCARELYGNLQRALAYIDGQCDPADGLVVSDPVETWTWHSPAIPGKEIGTNVLVAAGFADATRLALHLGRRDDAKRWSVRAVEMATSINRLLWDQVRGAYVVSELFPDSIPQDGNVWAPWFGVATPEQSRRALDYVRANHWGPLGPEILVGEEIPVYGGPYISPLVSSFELLARLVHGDEGGAFELLRRCWGWQLDNDPASTTWERFAPDGSNYGAFAGPAGESKSHGWGAGPAIAGSKLIAGVQPVAPGYRQFRVDPHPGHLQWCEAVVPTPYGPITVEWERATDGELHLRVDAPDGTERIS